MEQRAHTVTVTDLEEFRALSLLLQHRALVRALDEMADAIFSCRDAELTSLETAARLSPLLYGFTQALPEHFAAESRSTTSLLQDGADPDFERRLRELDGEHPLLLERFEVVLGQLNAHISLPSDPQPLEPVVAELLSAIEHFRRHEEEEDALFIA
jgi:hypothetical protein